MLYMLHNFSIKITGYLEFILIILILSYTSCNTHQYLRITISCAALFYTFSYIN